MHISEGKSVLSQGIMSVPAERAVLFNSILNKYW